MMWAMILLGLSQVAQPNLESRSGFSISIPEEIAPAVIPYFQCMMQDGFQHLVGVSTAEAARAGIQRALEMCRPARDEAEGRARTMLRSTRYPAAERERMISDTLASIDHGQDHIAEHLDRVNARLTAKERTDAPD